MKLNKGLSSVIVQMYMAIPLKWIYMMLVGILLFIVLVNSHGHVETVSDASHTFHVQA